MSNRLSQQQHSVLCAVEDWKAPYEVSAALYPSGHTAKQAQAVRQALNIMLGRGLVERNRAQMTYRITDAGRAAIDAFLKREAA
jgi:repressor of nif and glnA expression